MLQREGATQGQPFVIAYEFVLGGQRFLANAGTTNSRRAARAVNLVACLLMSDSDRHSRAGGLVEVDGVIVRYKPEGAETQRGSFLVSFELTRALLEANSPPPRLFWSKPQRCKSRRVQGGAPQRTSTNGET